MLGIYEMNAENTIGIGAVLDEFAIGSLPEAHCYLCFKGKRIDVTRFSKRNIVTEKQAKKILYEERILPAQIGDYKLALHRSFFRAWMRGKNLNEKFRFEELWSIRERCIAALSES